MKPKTWKRWAVVSANGKLCKNLQWQAAIYSYKTDAEKDCAKGQHVVRVLIIEDY